MAIPINEDTRDNEAYYIGMDPPNNHFDSWENDTGADVAKGDIVIMGSIVGVADANIEDGDDGSINIGEGDIVVTSRLAPGSTFPTQGAEVWYDPATGLVQDVSANNLYGIGTLLAPRTDAGVIVFLKRRYWVREAFYAET